MKLDPEVIEAFLSRHERVVLSFSAGKDAAACLYLMEPWWGRFDVVWCNGGDPYPEALAYMQRIAAKVPRFKMLLGQLPQWFAEVGYPADIVPCEASPFGAMFEPYDGQKFVPRFSCCNANLWMPFQEYMLSNGVTGVIRGQKATDKLTSPLRGLAGTDGKFEFLQPVWELTDQQVLDYLGPRAPESYARGIPVSLECRSCTAYVADSQERLTELASTFPEVYMKVSAVQAELARVVAKHLRILES